MKINRVSEVKVNKYNSGNVSLTNNNITLPALGNSSNLNFQSAVIGRSQISFGNQKFALEYQPEINNDYFHLPEGSAPDEYQIDAAKHLHMGEDVLVTAPTGTGKTAIAQYIISKNLEEGKRTFYTTPLKALSNQKLNQLTKIYDAFKTKFGESNVGIMTGDIKINPEAPVVVMTTEIYKNMLGAPGKKLKGENRSHQLNNLGTVIFDELHYMGDIDRGRVWMQSIMQSGHTQLLSLSATIGNGQEVAEWMKQVKHRPTYLVDVPASKRHVPLEFHNQHLCPYDPSEPFAHHADLAQHLRAEDKLPAAYFIYSKNKINGALDYFKDLAQTNRSFVLTTVQEQKEIQSTVDKYKDRGVYLGEGLDYEALKYGYAPHSAGMLPAQKELIEELGQARLVKIILTTETLGAGINFPIKTAVMTSSRKPVSLQKFADGDDGKRQITMAEFHQQSGRAGRRGIDIEGYVYTMPEDKTEQKVFETLIKSAPEPIKSTYSPAFSEIAGYHQDTTDSKAIKEFLKSSFIAFDKDKSKKALNTEKLFKTFEHQRDILRKFDFITAENTLMPKGLLVAEMNGYAQVPVVENIFNKKLPVSSLADFTASVASLSTVSEAVAYKIERQKEYETKMKKRGGFSYTDLANTQAKEGLTTYESPSLTAFVENLETYLQNHNETMKRIDPKYEKVALDKPVVERIFDWAKLNIQSDSPVKNWQELFQKHAKNVDEGGIFNEIYRTVNLLKQIDKMAEKASRLKEFAADEGYYKTLSKLAKDAVELIKKDAIFIHGI